MVYFEMYEFVLYRRGINFSCAGLKGVVHFKKKKKKKLLLIIYSPPCHPRCLSFFLQSKRN